MIMLEKDIERRVCDYAKSRGMLAYKFSSPNHAAVPDRLMIHQGIVFFIEFKRGGEKPTIPQAREHNRMRQHGASVYVIDDVDAGKQLIDSICNATPVSAARLPKKGDQSSVFTSAVNAVGGDGAGQDSDHTEQYHSLDRDQMAQRCTHCGPSESGATGVEARGSQVVTY